MCIYRTYDIYIVHVFIIFFIVHICTLVLFYVHLDKIIVLWGGVCVSVFLTQIGENCSRVFFRRIKDSRGFLHVGFMSFVCGFCVILCYLCYFMSFVSVYFFCVRFFCVNVSCL